jgi:hypothetical protein
LNGEGADWGWDEGPEEKRDEENYYERLNRHESRYFIFCLCQSPEKKRKTEMGAKHTKKA